MYIIVTFFFTFSSLPLIHALSLFEMKFFNCVISKIEQNLVSANTANPRYVFSIQNVAVAHELGVHEQ